MVDVLIIGAGQAGLGTARALQKKGISFIVYERHKRIGDSWRERYDSLILFSPRCFDNLPGLVMSGDPDGYPTKDEIADYLELYAQTFALPVVTGEAIIDLASNNGLFIAHTERETLIEAKAVIVAVGAFRKPKIPDLACRLSGDVIQFDAVSYRRPGQLPSGRVAIIGAGATGRQIAAEVAATHKVWLSCGRPQFIVPQRILGRDATWWFNRLGALHADKNTLFGRLVRLRDAFPGWHLRSRALKRAGIHVVKRVVYADGEQLNFADGATGMFRTVIWATGYQDDTSWLSVPGAIDDRGHVLEDRGVSPVSGLLYVGRSWQNNRASALLCGVGDEADAIVKPLLAHIYNS